MFELVLLLFAVFSAPCEFPTYFADPTLGGIPVVPASDVTSCLVNKTRTISKEQMESFLNTVITYTKAHSFQYRFMDAPNGIKSFDMVSELETLKTRIETLSAYELFEEIWKVIKKLRDCHGFVNFPFFTAFYILPVRFIYDGTKFYALHNGDVFITSEMDFTGTGDGYLPVEKAISNFAVEEVFMVGYDPHAQFNTLLSTSPYTFIFEANQMFKPEERYGRVLLKGQNFADKTQISDHVIDWVGVYQETEDSETLKAKHGDKKFLRNLALGPTPPSRSPSHSTAATKASNEVLAFVETDLLFNDSSSQTLIWTDVAKKIGYVKLSTFVPSGSLIPFGEVERMKTFWEGFGKGYKEMVDRGVKDVIVDVRGNGGGSLGVLETLLDFLFRDTLYPTVMVGDFPKSPFNEELAKLYQNYLTSIIFDADTGRKVTDFYNEETVIKDHMNMVTNPPTPIPTAYTKKVAYNRSLGTPALSAAFGGTGHSPFTPEHVYIVTNGMCMSCCGIFTRMALETKSARVIGFGYNPEFEGKYKTYAPGSCPGGVVNTALIQQVSSGIPQGVVDFSVMPGFDFPDAGMSWTHFEFYSRNPKNFHESMFFVNVTVQEVFPHPTTGVLDFLEDIQTVATTLYNEFITQPSRCFAGEVKVDEACTNAERTANHQLWGRPCAAGVAKNVFSRDLCKFAFCSPGYYLSALNASTGSGVCLAIPSGSDDPISKKGAVIPGWGVALIVLAAVFIVALVLAVVVILYVFVFRKKDDGGTTLYNNPGTGKGTDAVPLTDV